MKKGREYIYSFFTFGSRIYNGNQTGRWMSNLLLRIGRETKAESGEGYIVTFLLLTL